jgi:hypothetical protein
LNAGLQTDCYRFLSFGQRTTANPYEFARLLNCANPQLSLKSPGGIDESRQRLERLPDFAVIDAPSRICSADRSGRRALPDQGGVAQPAGRKTRIDQGQLDVGVSGARVEWQEGEGVRERTSPRSVDCEPLVCQLRRESGSAGRGSAAATGFQISYYDCLTRLLLTPHRFNQPRHRCLQRLQASISSPRSGAIRSHTPSVSQVGGKVAHRRSSLGCNESFHYIQRGDRDYGGCRASPTESCFEEYWTCPRFRCLI